MADLYCLRLIANNFKVKLTNQFTQTRFITLNWQQLLTWRWWLQQVFKVSVTTNKWQWYDHILKFINVLNIHFWETIAMIIYIGSSLL